MKTSTEVRDRYGELTTLLTSMASRGQSEAGTAIDVMPRLLEEARILDGGFYDRWLDGWAAEAVFWVPLGAITDPGADQSLLLDDRRRLEERIRWRREPSAWGQQPPSTTCRLITSIEAWRDGDRIVTRSGLMLEEHRRSRSQTLIGYQVHELIGPELACRTKILLLPGLALGVRNPSFLL